MVMGVVSCPIPGKHSQATAPQIALKCTVSLVGGLMQQSWKMLEVLLVSFCHCICPTDTTNQRNKKVSAASCFTHVYSMFFSRIFPLQEFTSLRDTFKMFDARGLSGVVNLETFLQVIQEVCQARLHGVRNSMPAECIGISWDMMECVDAFFEYTYIHLQSFTYTQSWVMRLVLVRHNS